MALAATPLAAAQEAETVVPPGNSAVNQYTETFPTSRGNQGLHKGRQGAKRTPKEVLGTRNERRLGKHGSDGRAVAELTAETAPTTPGATAGTAVKQAPSTGPGAQRKTDSGGRQPLSRDNSPQSGVNSPTQSNADSTDGSSGLGEVVGEATGTSSSGELGLLLPLLILATAAWALLYGLRHHRRRVS